MTRFFAFLATLLLALPSNAAQLDVIVDRGESAVEIFVSLRALDIPAVFGNSPDFIAPPGVTVAYEELREGTWDQGDAMITGAALRVGQVDAPLEAMSLMVHPKDAPMPFRDVADAYLAMSVCNGFAPGTVPTVDILHVYAGYIAYPVDPLGELLSLSLGNTDVVDVTVRDMTQGVQSASYTMTVAPGATLELRPTEAPVAGEMRFFLWLTLGAFVVLLGAVGRIWLERCNEKSRALAHPAVSSP